MKKIVIGFLLVLAACTSAVDGEINRIERLVQRAEQLVEKGCTEQQWEAVSNSFEISCERLMDQSQRLTKNQSDRLMSAIGQFTALEIKHEAQNVSNLGEYLDDMVDQAGSAVKSLLNGFMKEMDIEDLDVSDLEDLDLSDLKLSELMEILQHKD